MLKKLDPYWLWAVLALPAVSFVYQALTSTNPRILHILVHPTGEFAARFLIVAMIATPICLLLKTWRGPRWLRKNRRYFGVGAFFYAAFHTVLYLIDRADIARILEQATHFDMLTGWIAFAIFIPLAVTSADYFVRKMGTGWKALQRWTYAAAVLTFLHWAALHGWREPLPAIVQFSPLILLSIWRIWHVYSRRRARAQAHA